MAPGRAGAHLGHSVRDRVHHESFHGPVARHRRRTQRGDPGHPRQRPPARPGRGAEQGRRPDHPGAPGDAPFRAAPSPVGLLTEGRAVLVQGTNPYQEWTPERVLEALAATRLRRAPGSGRIVYSNLGAGLLGLALVAAAGAGSYGEL